MLFFYVASLFKMDFLCFPQDSIVVDNSTKTNSSSAPANELQCQLLDERVVNCSSRVYSNKYAWRTSRCQRSNTFLLRLRPFCKIKSGFTKLIKNFLQSLLL
jgi:hypothetical protein